MRPRQEHQTKPPLGKTVRDGQSGLFDASWRKGLFSRNGWTLLWAFNSPSTRLSRERLEVWLFLLTIYKMRSASLLGTIGVGYNIDCCECRRIVLGLISVPEGNHVHQALMALHCLPLSSEQFSSLLVYRSFYILCEFICGLESLE